MVSVHTARAHPLGIIDVYYDLIRVVSGRTYIAHWHLLGVAGGCGSWAQNRMASQLTDGH